STSNGNVVMEEQRWYPDDITSFDFSDMSAMESQEYLAVDRMKKLTDIGSLGLHQINHPIQSEIKVTHLDSDINSKLTNRVNYKTWSNGLILPESIEKAKGDEALTKDFQYHNYDNYGNPTEVSVNSGSHIYYLWGYKGRFPIARIDNFTSMDAQNIEGLI